MDADLISKRELLELCGISYGALYRWKRKGLIPEEWFIKKSTYTGQETFFPREKTLKRIELILSRKENVTLDELADGLSPVPKGAVKIDGDAPGKLISPSTLELLKKAGWGTGDALPDFTGMLHALCVDRLLMGGGATREEAVSALSALWAVPPGREGLCLSMYRKLGVGFCIISGENAESWIDGGVKLAARVPLDELAEELRQALEQDEDDGQ